MAVGFSIDTGQLEIGSYRGAPIYLSPLFFILAALLANPFWRMVNLTGVALALVFMAVALLSILLHELAHAEVARRYGVATERIDILMMGGLVHLRGLPRTMMQDFAITTAGPLANLAIGLVALLGLMTLMPAPSPEYIQMDTIMVRDLMHGPGAFDRLLRATAYLNIGLFILNIVPAVPLDGGKLLYLLAERRWNARVALQLVGALGMVFAGISFLVSLISALALVPIWAPPYFKPNWQAFDAACRGHGDWNLAAFPNATPMRRSFAPRVFPISTRSSIKRVK